MKTEIVKKIRFVLYFIVIYFSLSGCNNLFAKDYFYVRWVDDGDTIVLEDGRRVRYIGINAPEVEHENKKGEPFGNEARVFNQELVLHKKVSLEFDKEKYDHYGRLLAYVILPDNKIVNKKLVEEGYAYVLPQKSGKKYDTEILESQHQAMSAKKGIWGYWQEKGYGYVGNKFSKRFHLSTCRYGSRMSKKNIVYFSTKWEAFWAGFAPCKECIY